MDITTLRAKTPRELDTLLADSRAQLSELRFRLHAHELKNVHEIRETRRMIARILTIMNSRQATAPTLRPGQADSRKQSEHAAA